MSCLTHDKRFRSALHSIVNELRNNKQMSVDILRSLPNKCCTCNEQNELTIKPVIVKEDNQYEKLKLLIERVNREKQTNPKLILSLNRLENLIEEHCLSVTEMIVPSVPVQHRIERNDSSSSSSSSSDDVTPMDTSKFTVRGRRFPQNKTQKPPKPIKNGTFLFLPYSSTKTSDPLIEVAKVFQRSKFINRRGHIPQLEKQYDVCINMITSKTKQLVLDALENAKKGLDKLTIHNKDEILPLAEKQEGEWVLIRAKTMDKNKKKKKTDTTDIEQLFDDLTLRWKNCLNIEKRKVDDSDDDSNDSSWKRK